MIASWGGIFGEDTIGAIIKVTAGLQIGCSEPAAATIYLRGARPRSGWISRQPFGRYCARFKQFTGDAGKTARNVAPREALTGPCAAKGETERKESYRYLTIQRA
jgi:hypothetical protein